MRFIKGEMHTLEGADSLTLPRRRFVQGIAAAGLATFLEGRFNQADAEAVAHSPTILTGTHFDLDIEPHHVDFTRRQVKAIKINGSLPAPTLKWREGDTVTVAVTNHLPDATSIHWHGVRVPADMDGVPGLSFAGIAPGKTFVYRIPVVQNGTYWYHSHSGPQEQIGLIIEAAPKYFSFVWKAASATRTPPYDSFRFMTHRDYSLDPRFSLRDSRAARRRT